MVNPEAVGTTLEAQPTTAGTASAAVPLRDTSAEHFGYFPGHYVNKVTTAEEQPPTF